MPHAALWVVQHRKSACMLQSITVSMPHAALWVVQLRRDVGVYQAEKRFNAARGFVGGAASSPVRNNWCFRRFNAARGFVGGAA